MDFKELVRLARRRWKTIAAIFVLALAASTALTVTSTPVYHSTARIYIATTGDTTNSQYFQGAYAAQQAESYAALATSRELMQRVVTRLDLNLTPNELGSHISASVVPKTVLIQVEAKDTSARVAQQMAQAEVKELADYLNTLGASPDGSTQSIRASVVDPADFVADPIAPKATLNLIVGGFLGLLGGLALALVRELLDNSVSSAADVEKVLDIPVLAGVGRDTTIDEHPLISEPGTTSVRTEAFRLLRTNLQFLNPDTRPRSIVITSALPSEGKTTTAVNLAIALAQTGLRVLLVDGDLRRPSAAGLLGLERSVGLTTVLVGRSELNDSIQRHHASGVYFLASGPIPPNPTEILQSKAAQHLFDTMEGMFDMVILDAPPLLPVSDAAIMARDVDGALLVVRHAKTTREQVRLSAQRLQQVGANLLGVVINVTPKKSADYDGYAYGYGYEPLAPASGRRAKGA